MLFTASYITPVEFLITCWITQQGIQFDQSGITLDLNLDYMVVQILSNKHANLSNHEPVFVLCAHGEYSLAAFD